LRERKVQPIQIGKRGAHLALDKGLPANIDAERFILGSVLLDDSRWRSIAGIVTNDDFALEKHRRIFGRMRELHERGEKIDRVTIADELLRYNELESVDGLSYIVSLDDGLPHIANLDSYVRIVRSKATLRRIAIAAQQLMNRALMAEDDPEEILAGMDETAARIRGGATTKTMSVADIPLMETFGAQKLDWVVHTMLVAGTVMLVTGDSGSGKSSLVSAICCAISGGDSFAGLRTQRRPVVYLDKENGLPIVAERFSRLGISDSPDFRYWGAWCQSDPAAPTSSTIVSWVKSCDIKPVIVVDSFGAFSDGVDENDAAQVRKWMNGPRRLADLGATVIVLHNSSAKTDSAKDFRGSSVFKDATDVGYCVTNMNPDPSRLGPLRLKAWKPRVAVATEILFDVQDGQFTVDSRAPAQTAIKMLRDLLIASPGIRSREFEAAAIGKGISRVKVRDFIKNGISEKTIDKIDGPKNEQKHFWIGEMEDDL
jgi:archaellum biogenesis ATPase FlaH